MKLSNFDLGGDVSQTSAQSRIVDSIIVTLSNSSDTLAGIDPILHQAGLSRDAVTEAFPGMVDLFVAVAQREARMICEPLLEPSPRSINEAHSILVSFGKIAWRKYSTTLIGFIRVMMAEATHKPPLKKNVYEVGPKIVTSTLRQFLSDANDADILSVSDAQLSAEHLIGMLREPLYQALMLHPIERTRDAVKDPVQESVDRFIRGCSTAGRSRS